MTSVTKYGRSDTHLSTSSSSRMGTTIPSKKALQKFVASQPRQPDIIVERQHEVFEAAQALASIGGPPRHDEPTRNPTDTEIHRQRTAVEEIPVKAHPLSPPPPPAAEPSTTVPTTRPERRWPSISSSGLPSAKTAILTVRIVRATQSISQEPPEQPENLHALLHQIQTLLQSLIDQTDLIHPTPTKSG